MIYLYHGVCCISTMAYALLVPWRIVYRMAYRCYILSKDALMRARGLGGQVYFLQTPASHEALTQSYISVKCPISTRSSGTYGPSTEWYSQLRPRFPKTKMSVLHQLSTDHCICRQSYPYLLIDHSTTLEMQSVVTQILSPDSLIQKRFCSSRWLVVKHIPYQDKIKVSSNSRHIADKISSVDNNVCVDQPVIILLSLLFYPRIALTPLFMGIWR